MGASRRNTVATLLSHLCQRFASKWPRCVADRSPSRPCVCLPHRRRHGRTILACSGVVEMGVKKLIIYRRTSSDRANWRLQNSAWERVSTVFEAPSDATDLANCMLAEVASTPTAPSSHVRSLRRTTSSDDVTAIIASYRFHTNKFPNGTWGTYSIMSQRSPDGAVRHWVAVGWRPSWYHVDRRSCLH